MVKSEKVRHVAAAAAAAAAVGGVDGGRIAKAAGQDYFEMQAYLSKLKQLVPNMPKNRKVSKVEVIEHVIDYICHLQTALETQPSNRATAAIVSVVINNNNNNATSNSIVLNNNNNNNSICPANPRQPLCAISAAAANAFTNSCAQEVNPLDSSSDCAPNRTVSC